MLIAATYFYFLLFAEFAFLSLSRTAGAQPLDVQRVMAALGVGGIVGSLLAAASAQLGSWPQRLAGGLTGCALAGFAALGKWSHVSAFMVDGCAIGLCLGWTTVTLALGLKSLIGEQLGAWIGLGTGIAYAACNLPFVFESNASTQTALASGGAGLAALLCYRLSPTSATPQPWPAADYTLRGRVAWIGVLLALVWLDSGAFFIIQQTTALKAATWSGPAALLVNGAVHLTAALVAGWALDRGGLAVVAVGALLALVIACALLHHSAWAEAASICYVAGVSFYSVLLVFYPARSGSPWLAAAVYSVAGWLGSALGIGMAQNLREIPYWFLAVALILVGAAMTVRSRRLAPMALGAVVLSLLTIPPQAGAAEGNALVTRGREVYIAEGCIHCHSQYVRPGTADVDWWGPAQPLSERLKETPPLFGNRRQGPDLTNVGNRRSAEWQRLHLLDPTSTTPGSRMPRYAHLFQSGNESGEALLRYLDSLGADTRRERFAYIRSWLPRPASTEPKIADGRSVYGQNCVQCHGPEGGGNGPLSQRLTSQPRNFSRDEWHYLAAYGENEPLALARVIKFGIGGTAMPGHEWLTDDDVLALVALVRSWHSSSTAATDRSP